MKKWIFRLRHYLQLRLCCLIPLRYLKHGIKFPHPVGIVIGDGVRIGKEVRIYQNVTLGLIKNAPGAESTDMYPVIEDEVIIYAGAVVIGPIRIGAGSVIGANSIVTKDVPPGSVVVGRNEIKPPKTKAGDDSHN